MHRYTLRDCQWLRIKDMLPAAKAMSEERRRTIGYSSTPWFSAIGRVFRNVICPGVAVTCNRLTGAIANGEKVAFLCVISKCWRAMPTTN